MALIGLYLIATLALPLYAMLSKSMTTFRFDLAAFEVQINRGDGWQPPLRVSELAGQLPADKQPSLATNSDGRLAVVDFIEGFSFRGPEIYRFRNAEAGAVHLAGSLRIADMEWHEYSANDFRRVTMRPAASRGLENYITYFSTPSLVDSIWNSVFVASFATVITVVLAFVFAYALLLTCIPGKGFFRLVMMIPILVPSLLPGIALIYMFGKQGFMTPLLFGHSIYGPIGIIIGSVFFSLPHAFIIIATALALSDARLHEAAISLRASPLRRFLTVTLPGARYGLISAAFVTFTLVITDFGLPKVIGGQFNVLAVDIYKQVIGQQNFEMGAVVSVVLLIPAVAAFIVDRIVTRRQQSVLSARSVPYAPRPNRRLDGAAFLYCIAVSCFIVGILLVCQFAALVKLWPYDLSLGLANFDFSRTDGGGWEAYFNSIRMALYVAVAGTAIVFVGAYVVEKMQGMKAARGALHMLAILPLAVPGLVLGLSYIFFFNDPANPLHVLYGTMTILVVSSITHFYTVSHLTALTALKQLDPEFESVSASLKQPAWRLFSRVTVPVCMPPILDISIYLFVNAMTTVSAVVFLYSPTTKLASVAVLNMDDAGDIASAAAMGMMIFYTNVIARGLHAAASRGLMRRTQAWRAR
ncbi:putative 2-aminoethylphosphonate ABC transporter permease subunit [Aestuariivirga sp.]|uniref:putative 2-aminoethylphosphonate ABC transporter permease subunit n=1 Tax=Aestuariivirga sp. TaxID=2650926 RepID=UPI00391A9670